MKSGSSYCSIQFHIMNRSQELKRLRHLQSEADAIRRKLRISPSGAVLYSSPLCSLEDEVVVVEADGVGGATTSVVEGNYPVDYITKFEQHFASEDIALRQAEELVEKHVIPSIS